MIARTVLVVVLLLSVARAATAQPAGSPGSPTGPYKGFDYPWENNTLGIDRTVPAPWTPMKVDGRTVSMLWKTVAWDGGLLPDNITVRETPLLARPMRLVLSVDGREVSDRTAEVRVTDAVHNDAVTLAGTLKAGALTVEQSVTVEFDGWMVFRYRLVPQGKATVDRFVVEMPFRRDVARMFSRYFTYKLEQRFGLRGQIDEAAGFIDEPMQLPFTAQVWVGNRTVGAELNLETDLAWSNDKRKAIELVPGRDDMVLRVNCITKKVDLTEPVEISFGLFLTPSKPRPKNWRTWVFCNHMRTPPEGLDPKLWYFSTVREGPVPPFCQYPGRPIPPRDPQLRKQRDAIVQGMREAGVNFIPYSALLDVFGGAPELKDYYPYWLRHEDSKGSQGGIWYRQLTDKLADDRPGAAFGVTTYTQSYRDFVVWTYHHAAAELKHGGFFFDIAAAGHPIVNHKIGRVSNLEPSADDELPRSQIHEVYSIHDVHKRLYKACKGVNPQFKITQHHSKVPLMYGGFSDVIYTGEALNYHFRRLGRHLAAQGKLPEGHPPYVPDHGMFSDAFYIASYLPEQGHVNMFFAQVRKGNDKWIREREDEFVAYSREVIARTALLDTPNWYGRMHHQTYLDLLRGWQKHFGGLVDPIVYIDPLQSGKLVAARDAAATLKLAAYIRPDGRAALMVGNWTDKPASETLTPNLKTLGLAGGKIASVVDIEDRTPPKHTDTTITVTVPAQDYRILVLK